MAGDGRILKLHLAVLAAITQVRRDSRHLAGTGVLERTTEEQQPAQLVVCAVVRVAIERVKDDDRSTVDRFARPAFVFSVLVVALFMC